MEDSPRIRSRWFFLELETEDAIEATVETPRTTAARGPAWARETIAKVAMTVLVKETMFSVWGLLGEG
jgi:hypothetical protein